MGAVTEESVKKNIGNQKSTSEVQNDEEAKSCRDDCNCSHRAVHRCRHVILAAIVLFIVADMLFSLDLPRQNFFTLLIAFICILFIGWCVLSRPRK